MENRERKKTMSVCPTLLGIIASLVHSLTDLGACLAPKALLHCHQQDFLGAESHRKNNRGFLPLSLTLKASLLSLQRPEGRASLGAFFLCTPVCTSVFGAAFESSLGNPLGGGEGRLPSSLVMLSILIFPNFPSIVYFAESSIHCPMHSSPGLQLHSVGDTRWNMFTPSCPDLETLCLFFGFVYF